MSLFPKFQVTEGQLQDPAIPANIANLDENVSEISDFSNPLQSPDSKSGREKSMAEAVALLKKRGWVQVFSSYLNQSIYLTRNKWIKVPDSALPKYTRNEIAALNGLDWEEIQTLHEAKILFKGEIL